MEAVRLFVCSCARRGLGSEELVGRARRPTVACQDDSVSPLVAGIIGAGRS